MVGTKAFEGQTGSAAGKGVTFKPQSHFSTLFAPLSCYLRDLGRMPFPFGGFHRSRLRLLNRSPETIFVLAVLVA